MYKVGYFGCVPVSDCTSEPYDCASVLRRNPGAESGVYTICSFGESHSVFCDMETDGGGWTVRTHLFYFKFSILHFNISSYYIIWLNMNISGAYYYESWHLIWWVCVSNLIHNWLTMYVGNPKIYVGDTKPYVWPNRPQAIRRSYQVLHGRY